MNILKSEIVAVAKKLVEGVENTPENKANWKQLAEELYAKRPQLGWSGWQGDVALEVLKSFIRTNLKDILGINRSTNVQVYLDGKLDNSWAEVSRGCLNENYGKPDEYFSGVSYNLGPIEMTKDLFEKLDALEGTFTKIFFESFDEKSAKGYSGGHSRYSVVPAGHNYQADAWKEVYWHGSFTGGGGKTISLRFLRVE